MAMVKEPVIFQVSGYQNSGKTTLVNKIISGLKGKGLSVVTIKHHGHGGKPETPEGKDSSNHIESGAAASIVEGGGRLRPRHPAGFAQQHWPVVGRRDLAGVFEPR